MISRFLLLVLSVTKKKALTNFTEFFNHTQIFHPLYSMLCTVNLGLRDSVGFLQIRSQLIVWATRIKSATALQLIPFMEKEAK